MKNYRKGKSAGYVTCVREREGWDVEYWTQTMAPNQIIPFRDAVGCNKKLIRFPCTFLLREGPHALS